MRYGTLVKELGYRGLLSPQCQIPFPGYSFENIFSSIRDIKNSPCCNRCQASPFDPSTGNLTPQITSLINNTAEFRKVVSTRISVSFRDGLMWGFWVTGWTVREERERAGNANVEGYLANLFIKFILHPVWVNPNEQFANIENIMSAICCAEEGESTMQRCEQRVRRSDDSV
jgi:hypothetical protein